MATIKDIADATGYSLSAVSRTINNDPTLSISSEARVKILSAAKELGYEKKRAARDPAAGYSVALVSYSSTFKNEIDSGYYFSVRSGIEFEAEILGISCDFINAGEIENYSQAYDGILIIGHLHKSDYARILNHFNTGSVAAVNSVYYCPELVDHVSYDNRLCTRLGLDCLFTHGHRRIAYLGHREFEDMSAFGSRKETFEAIMRERGLLDPLLVHECDRGVEESYKYVKNWLAGGPELPTAMFCANDPVAIGAMKAFIEEGISVPDKMSIVSVDGSFITRFSNPPISSVDVHTFELGRMGLRMLAERMSGVRDTVVQVNISPTLVERDSVASV